MAQLVTCAMLSSGSPLFPRSRQGAADGGREQPTRLNQPPRPATDTALESVVAAKGGGLPGVTPSLGVRLWQEQDGASGDHCREGRGGSALG